MKRFENLIKFTNRYYIADRTGLNKWNIQIALSELSVAIQVT